MYTTEAIILSIKRLGEADELVNFYTKDFGKLLIKAKSAKKITTRQGNFFHSPAIVRCSFVPTRAGFTLSGIKSLKEYPKISNNIFASGFVISFLELSNLVVHEGQKDKKLWNLIVRVLEEASGVVDESNCAIDCARGEMDARRTLWRMEKAWLLTLLAVLGLKPDKLELSSIKSPSGLDTHIKGILQDKFERSIYFFGLKMPYEHQK